jgi:hypothetical protein
MKNSHSQTQRESHFFPSVSSPLSKALERRAAKKSLKMEQNILSKQLPCWNFVCPILRSSDTVETANESLCQPEQIKVLERPAWTAKGWIGYDHRWSNNLRIDGQSHVSRPPIITFDNMLSNRRIKLNHLRMIIINRYIVIKILYCARFNQQYTFKHKGSRHIIINMFVLDPKVIEEGFDLLCKIRTAFVQCKSKSQQRPKGGD